jgi:hypothetical protein
MFQFDSTMAAFTARYALVRAARARCSYDGADFLIERGTQF